MSCGSGCGCCPKCGCQATCTCNHSMTWCDHTMSDFSYIGMEAVPRENAKCGASWDVPVEICSSGNSSECLYSEVAESGNHACLDGTPFPTKTYNAFCNDDVSWFVRTDAVVKDT